MGITKSETLNNSAMGPTLLLLRHGQILANKKRRWHGSTDSDLTFTGRRQAKATGRYLAKHKQRIDTVVASPLKRCQDTAKFASAHLDLPIETNDGLAEMSLGAWEDLPFDELHEKHDLYNKLDNDLEFSPPDGESLETVSARTVQALTEITKQAEPDHIVLVASHGVAMAIALATLLDQDPRRWRDYVMSNCAISELTLHPGPCLLAFNQTHHH